MQRQWPYPTQSISLDISAIKVDFIHYQLPQLKPGNNPVFINLHDNEKTSVRAALHCMQEHRCGSLFELSHQKTRTISALIDNKLCQFDPNRIFTAVGIENTLMAHQCFSKENHQVISKYADNIVKHITSSAFALLIALHNNENKAGQIDNYNIHSYLPGGDESANTEDIFKSIAHCPDNFFITTEHSLFSYLKRQGFNTVLHKQQGIDDGSLSYYCATHNIPYINVEAQHGHQHQQQQMINTLLNFLKK